MAPSVLLTLMRYVQLDGELTTSAWSRRQSVADLSAAVLQEKFDHFKDLALSLSTRVHFRGMVARGEWEDAIRVLKDIPQKDFPVIDRVFLTDVQGRLMADVPRAGGVVGQSFAQRDWYRSVSRNWKPCVSEIYRRAAEPRHNVIAIAAPIRSPESPEVVGILVMQIRLNTLLGWARSIDAGLSGSVYFADKNGHAAGWWPDLLDEKDIPDYSGEEPVREALKGHRGGRVVRDPRTGQNVLAAFSPVVQERWAVVVTQPEADAFEMKRRILGSFWTTSLALIALNALLALLILWLQANLLRHQRQKAQADAEREQLELFAFVASHDLQEPLNKIMAFGSLLTQTSRSGMDDSARDSLDRIVAAAQRMSRMIDDVREFSSIRQEGVRERVDLKEAAGRAIEELKEAIASCGASIDCGVLPEVTANPTQMKILFYNLIGNALKYRKKDQPLVVRIDAQKSGRNLASIRIRDNGIGIDEKYLKEIFAPFKRLHTHTEYEGTGLGLAICQRIVSLHGGRITASAGEGGGTVFTVTLPVKKG